MAQTAAHKAQEETRGYFRSADLLKKIEGQTPLMDGYFASYFAEVSFVPAQRVMNNPVAADNEDRDAYLERSTFAWIPYSAVADHLQKDIDGKKKYTLAPAYLPAGSETQWLWPAWLGNMRKAVVAGTLPWGKNKHVDSHAPIYTLL